MRLWLGLALALIAAPAFAADAGEAAAIALAGKRGQLLYAFDQAAWISTDAMVEKLPEADRPRIRGWVEEATEAGLKVTYYDDRAGEPQAVYVATVRAGKLVSDHLVAAGEDGRLSPLALRLYGARRAAADAERLICSEERPNTVVLPPETAGGPMAVYLLNPMTDAVIPFGGHSRIEVGADGKPGPAHDFTKGCIDFEADKIPTALVVSHLLDPTPTEIHVFMSLTLGKPVYVATGQRLWVVEGANITEIDRGAEKGK